MVSSSAAQNSWKTPEPRYAGFALRLFANLVDTFVALPLIALRWPGILSKNASVALAVPLFLGAMAYSFVMHARWGQTLGKMAAGIKVMTVAGAPIGWREALLRESVAIGLGTISTAASIVAVLHIADASWSHSWTEQAKLLGDARPSWGRAASIATRAWFWSELVILLFNRKRRALHDFIAGTIVIRKGSA